MTIDRDKGLEPRVQLLGKQLVDILLGFGDILVDGFMEFIYLDHMALLSTISVPLFPSLFLLAVSFSPASNAFNLY